jgi:predicted RNA-binding Zn-ribbon protein involved in translation (DUF1610 family)
MVYRQNADRLRLIAKLTEGLANVPRLDDSGTKIPDVLRPCHACGNDPVPRVWNDRVTGQVYLECGHCGWAGEEHGQLFDAIDAWNRGDPKRVTGLLQSV